MWRWGWLLSLCLATSAWGQLSALPRVPWEGGPQWWAQFTRANASGWTNPTFFPIAVFLPNPNHATQLRAIGINVAMGVNFDNDAAYTPRIRKVTDPDLNPATEDGLYALPHKEYEGTDNWTPTTVGNDNRAVGWFITDECEMGFSGCTGTQYDMLDTQESRTAAVRALDDGRFMWSNFGNGVSRTFWSPDTMDEHTKLMDGSSIDKYAYTSPQIYNSTDGVIVQSKNWPNNANAQRAATYGWMVDQMRIFEEAEPSPGDPTPNEGVGRRPKWIFVETARPLLGGESGATTITPDQMEGAVWNGIVHEARGVAYFPQNDDSCGGYSVITTDDQSQACVDALDARQDKLVAMHSKIASLATVLNTQSYVWNFSDDGNAANNVDTMLKAYNGYAYIFAAVGLNYTGEDTGDCETINLATVCKKLGTNQATGTKNFILPDGIQKSDGTTVEVVGESRSLTVTSGAFTDSFPNEYTHHVYKIALAATGQTIRVIR